MVFILDTHPLVWFLEGSPRLSAKAKDVLLDDMHLKEGRCRVHPHHQRAPSEPPGMNSL
jgi:hypothetical protein